MFRPPNIPVLPVLFVVPSPPKGDVAGLGPPNAFVCEGKSEGEAWLLLLFPNVRLVEGAPNNGFCALLLLLFAPKPPKGDGLAWAVLLFVPKPPKLLLFGADCAPNPLVLVLLLCPNILPVLAGLPPKPVEEGCAPKPVLVVGAGAPNSGLGWLLFDPPNMPTAFVFAPKPPVVPVFAPNPPCVLLLPPNKGFAAGVVVLLPKRPGAGFGPPNIPVLVEAGAPKPLVAAG